tara:strand:- start:6522 stop:6680 length:159 start_codon:yes stop_codon:yes gene_type:complete
MGVWMMVSGVTREGKDMILVEQLAQWKRRRTSWGRWDGIWGRRDTGLWRRKI